MSRFPVSDKFIAWASGLSAYCTLIKTDHGGIESLVQDAEWDRDKTILALTLLKGLKTSVSQLEKELRDHVENSY
jgi:hypothetical protein